MATEVDTREEAKKDQRTNTRLPRERRIVPAVSAAEAGVQRRKPAGPPTKVGQGF